MHHTTTAANTPDWVLCENCRAAVYGPRWTRNHHVCPECEHHSRVDGWTRLEQLADPGSVEPLDRPAPDDVATDVLGFVDTMPYGQRLARARSDTGLDGAVLSAAASIDGMPVVLAVMDFRFLGGSLGVVAGDRLVHAAEAALTRRVPLVVVTASGGARMQEGAVSLMQMARTSAAWARLDEAGLLTVSVVTDPTYGGVAASFATLSDVIVGERGARLGFAGRRVIEQTIGRELPSGFQTVEFLLERGHVDMVVSRTQLRPRLATLLRLGSARVPLEPVDRDAHVEPDRTVDDAEMLPVEEPSRQVREARNLDRPTMLDYTGLVLDDFQQLHGDRVSGDCPAMITGLASIAGCRVVIVGQQKGHTLAELSEHNFGMSYPAGHRKSVRVMRLAAKLGLPIVTLVDTPGAYPGEQAEEQGQAGTIAESLRVMMSLPVPIVTVVTGEGGSGGALGIAAANRVIIWQHAFYSVISPEGCASILWKDSAMGPAAAAALRLASRDLLRLGVVDGVVPEPAGGVSGDPAVAGTRLRSALVASLSSLATRDAAELVDERRRRFERFSRLDALEPSTTALRTPRKVGSGDEMAS
ncbi:acetyl-CoA carboxylase carboxyltransferase subunit alpha [Haloactinopolyspora alba]|uniref:Multifunctional fusion protein n=1 Tax=Haloactinopolyspora alba TaxID=648780 RepID=A0A2P8E915_9ACTN|nr:acetyl-CoA carboxylase carboxyltransferase subunit alpha/beta [Haloactinopolyspora alba]PSL05969.1 acetyl-CoA carboxylase carboxyltransferase subunit alpha [Haloactinopolyspora alba]